MGLWVKIKNKLELAGGDGKIIRYELQRPANATAYGANDVVVAASGNMGIIRNAARKPGGSFWLNGVRLLGDQAAGTPTAETWQARLWLFQKRRETPIADNATFASGLPAGGTGYYVTLRDDLYIGNITLPALAAPAGAAVDEAVIENLAIHLECAPGSRDIFFDVQTLTAFTPGSVTAGALYTLLFYITWD